jgi:mRNA interferase RelE/StbE
MYSIKFHKQVKKFIQSRTKQEKLRLKEKFQNLSENPFPNNQRLDIKKMEGVDFYRLRVGNYRFIFSIENSELVVYVEKAGNRGDIYK